MHCKCTAEIKKDKKLHEGKIKSGGRPGSRLTANVLTVVPALLAEDNLQIRNDKNYQRNSKGNQEKTDRIIDIMDIMDIIYTMDLIDIMDLIDR